MFDINKQNVIYIQRNNKKCISQAGINNTVLIPLAQIDVINIPLLTLVQIKYNWTYTNKYSLIGYSYRKFTFIK